jgi:uncharacterized protein (TIRG00374 family)
MIVRLAIAGTLVTYLFRSGAIEGRQLLGLLDAWTVTLGAFALLVANAVVVALRLPVLMRAQGFELGAFAAVRLALIGMFFNMFLPGGAGGDAVKIYYTVSDHHGRRAELATIVLFDRALAMLILLAWPLAAAPFFIDVIAASRPLQVVLAIDGALMLVGSGGLLLALAAPEAWMERGRGLLARFPRSDLLVRMANTVRAYRSCPGALVKALGISIVSHSMSIAAALWLAKAVSGAFAAPMLLLCPIGFLLNTIPITPGGLGVGEVAFERLFALAGLSGGAEVILAWRILLALIALSGLVFYLDGRRRFVEATPAAAPVANGRR